MSLGLRLDVRQSQNIVLTPQLQQAIRLLQLSNLELAKSVDKEVSENPFLEVAGSTTGGIGPTTSEPDKAGLAETGTGGRETTDHHDLSNAPGLGANDQRMSLVRSTPGQRDGTATDNLERYLVQPKSLVDHLQEQLAMIAMHEQEREVVRILLGYLDEDGFIRESDDELAAMLGVAREIVTDCREAICQCEPTGVGSYDLCQCLKVQLEERGRLTPTMQCLIDNLELVARAELASLANLCGIDERELQSLIIELKSLDPRPARNYASSEPGTMIPDLFVEVTADGWVVRLNQATLPRVVVDREYYASIRRSGLDRQGRDYVSERLQSANWLVKALDQRAQTMVRVGKAIFARQKPFLLKGPAGLQPLVLKQIAEATSLHESTVSRATADKYVATPHGTFSLKYFFSTAIADVSGQAIHSAEAIRQQIKRMIDEENSSGVLSDDQIVDRLKSDGVVLARRTVAKYRESMGIGSSVQRRRARALERQFAATR